MPRQSQLPWTRRAARSRHRVLAGAGRLVAQKIQHRLRDRLRLLKLGQVTGLRDHLHAGSSDSFGEFLGVTRRDDAIGVAPDDQRRRGDPMNATLEPAVGHRPNKLAGAGLRPDELRQHFDALARIDRDGKELLCGFTLWVGEQRGPALSIAEHHPVFDRKIVAPEPDWIDQRQFADRLRRRGRQFGRNQTTKRMTYESCRPMELQTIKQLAVINEEIEPIAEGMDPVWIAGRRAGVPRRINGTSARKTLDESAI